MPNPGFPAGPSAHEGGILGIAEHN